MQVLENPPYDDDLEKTFQIHKKLLRYLTYEDYNSISELAIDSFNNVQNPKYLYSWAIASMAIRKDLAGVKMYLEKGLENGVFFNKAILEYTIEELAEEPELQPLIEENVKMHSEMTKKVEAQLIIRTPSNPTPGKKYPLIVFFDGRHSDHTVIEYYWKEVLEQADIVFASLRSSQMHGTGKYAWDDEEASLRDVEEAFEILKKHEKVDLSKIIVSGMSQGTNIVMQAISNEIIPARGFLTVAQAHNPEKFFQEQPPTLIGKDLRGFIISGQKNEPRAPKHKRFHSLAIDNGIDCKLIAYPEIGHEYPDDFTELVLQSIKFILNND